MVFGFFHGVDTQFIDTVPRPVTVVPSAVILLVGTAPTYKATATGILINDPVRCEGDTDDAANFGAKTPGFTIPYALDAIRKNGGGTVEVVNVWNPATHKTVVTASTLTYAFPTTGSSIGKIQLLKVTGTSPTYTVVADSKAEGLTGTVTVQGAAGTPTHVENTDYTVDRVNGTITRVVGGAITAGATIRVATYTYADPSLVVASDIVGAVVSGDRTGLQAALDVFPLRGYRPKILIAPGFSESVTVSTALISMANALQAYTYIDAPVGATRDEAIAGRAGTAPVSVFATSSRRAELLYPRVKDGDGVLQPYSQFKAGLRARIDRDFGYWWSDSNKELFGVTGLERTLTADFTDANNDTSALNAAGISTVYNNFGTGYLSWGNRSAQYPTDTSPLNFGAVSRTLDIFHESLQRACLPYVDRPINNALIDGLEQTGNGFIREQVLLGALIEGSKLFYDPNQNPATALAAGRIVFSVSLMIPTPAEAIIIKTTLDITLLSEALAA